MATPFDYAGEQEQIKSRQALAQALLSQAFQPQQGQMIGPHYVGPGAGGALAPLLGVMASEQMRKRSAQDSADLRQRYNTAVSDGLEQYFATRDGKPAQGWSDDDARMLMEGNQVPTTEASPAVPRDPRRAAVTALTSGLPPLEKLGEADLASLGKSSLTPKDILGLSGFDPKSRLVAALTGDISGLSPELKEHVVNGQIVTGNPHQGYDPRGDFRDQYGDVGPVAQGPNGPIYGQRQESTGEVRFAPQGTNVQVNTERTAGQRFGTELAGERAKMLTESYKTAKDAAKAIPAIQAAEEDLANGIKSGALGEISLGLAKFGKAFGLDADPQIANTESFRGNMARQTFNLIKNLGSGTAISDADRKFAEKAAAGEITLDDTTMLRLMQIAKAEMGNTLLNHEDMLKQARGSTGAIDSDIDMFRVPFNLRSFNEGQDGYMFWDPTIRRFSVKGLPNANTRAGVPAAAPAQPGQVIRFEDLK